MKIFPCHVILFSCLLFSCLSFSCLLFSCLLFSCLSFSCFPGNLFSPQPEIGNVQSTQTFPDIHRYLRCKRMCGIYYRQILLTFVLPAHLFCCHPALQNTDIRRNLFIHDLSAIFRCHTDITVNTLFGKLLCQLSAFCCSRIDQNFFHIRYPRPVTSLSPMITDLEFPINTVVNILTGVSLSCPSVSTCALVPSLPIFST